jgi:hypothetical protein
MGVVPDEKTLSRHDGVAFWGTITAVAESPLSAGLLWVGADDGSVQVSRDSGQTWNNLAGRFPGFDENRAKVSRVVASRAAPGRAYVSFDRHQLDDLAPFIFTTDDFGENWRAISSGLPKVGWVNVVAEHPRNHDLLFAGTETGLFVSTDRGKRWTRLVGSFPTVPVDDLVIHPRENDLVVGTHGRAIYILDDLTPLEQLTEEVLKSPAHLFDVRTAYMYVPWKHESYGAQRQFIGKNPPQGAIISYYLRLDTEEKVSLSIIDSNGSSLRELKGTSKRGLNRLVWDLRTASFEGAPHRRGQLVTPGIYTVRLMVGEQPLEKSVEVKVDPRANVTREELQERFEFLSETGRLLVESHEASNKTNRIQEQITRLLENGVPDKLGTSANEVLAAAKQIRAQLVGPNGGRASGGNPSLQRQLGRLFGELDGDEVRQGTLHGPTEAQRQRLASARREVDEQIGRLNELLETSIPDLNRQIGEAKLPWIRIQ